jgi:hypothetical protein
MIAMSYIHERIQMDIESHGHSVIGVQGSHAPSFSYTVGLFKEFGFELFCIGLSPKHAMVIFNDIANVLRDGGRIDFNVADDRFSNLPCMFVEADQRAHEYVIQADDFFDTPVRVVQMVLSDRAGLLPGHRDYDQAYMGPLQPLLFTMGDKPLEPRSWDLVVNVRPKGARLN